MTIPELKQDIVFTAPLLGRELTFHSTWGLFSPKAIDEGSRLLLDHLEVPRGARLFDLGCGYGPLGLALAAADPSAEVHVVDKDFVAVAYAERNALVNQLSNVKAYLSNGFDQAPLDARFDVIVSNVPAKIGTELLQIFLHDAYDRLVPGGQLYVVTISGLKEYMKRHLNEVFGSYDKLKQSKTYTAARAVKRP